MTVRPVCPDKSYTGCTFCPGFFFSSSSRINRVFPLTVNLENENFYYLRRNRKKTYFLRYFTIEYPGMYTFRWYFRTVVLTTTLLRANIVKLIMAHRCGQRKANKIILLLFYRCVAESSPKQIRSRPPWPVCRRPKQSTNPL